MPRFAPELRPYWEATTAGRLVLPQCTECGVVVWYPRPFCPACGHSEVRWIESPGLGTVYTFTRNERGDGPFAGIGPYILAYVELDEGPRVLTNIVDCDFDDVHIGQRVEPVFHPTEGPGALLRFRPSSG